MTEGLGGMPPVPLNAPAGVGPAPGVQPGQSSGIVTANKVIVFGTAGGVFVYNGTPASGNPPIFWATSATVDPFGNALPSTAGIAGTGTFQAGNTIITPAGTFGYSGTPALGNLVYSDTAAATTDSFGNAVLGGVVTYFFNGANYVAVQSFQGNLNFLNASAESGPWNTYSSLEPDTTTGLLSFFDNQGNAFTFGTASKYNTTLQNITSTTPVVVGLDQAMSWNVESGLTYHLKIFIVYTGAGAVGTPVVGFDGSGSNNAVNGYIQWYGNGMVFQATGSGFILSTFVNQPGPTLNTGNNGVIVEAWFICTSTGTFNVRAQEGTAGDAWSIKGSAASLDVVGG